MNNVSKIENTLVSKFFIPNGMVKETAKQYAVRELTDFIGKYTDFEFGREPHPKGDAFVLARLTVVEKRKNGENEMNYEKIESELTDEQKIAAFVEIAKGRDRMCDWYEGCMGCPRRGLVCNILNSASDEQNIDIAKVVVEWSKSNPEPEWTYKDEFFKRCPDAEKDKNGYPKMSKNEIFGGELSIFVSSWDEPYFEVDK